MKKTAVACSNLALIKYWGKVDFEKRLPTNDSLSVNLDNLTTTTTVDFSARYKKDLLEKTINIFFTISNQYNKRVNSVCTVERLSNLWRLV